MQTPQNSPTKRRYHHLSQNDRDRIQALLDAGVDKAEIARIIGRHKSTVGREIARNKRVRGDIPVTNREQYQASTANHKAYVTRKYAKYQGKKIQENRKNLFKISQISYSLPILTPSQLKTPTRREKRATTLARKSPVLSGTSP